jgi:hypothetical protein
LTHDPLLGQAEEVISDEPPQVPHGTGAGFLAAPFVSEAQQAGPVRWIGLLGPDSPGPGPEEFRRGFSELGYVEGRNIRFERPWAENKIARLLELMSSIVTSP